MDTDRNSQRSTDFPGRYAHGPYRNSRIRKGSILHHRFGYTTHMPRHFLLRLLLGMLSAATPGLFVPGVGVAQVIKSGPPTCPGVALTFDLCPVRKGSGYDQPLMDYLIEHRIPATFFMSGKWMAKHEAEVDRLLGMGFLK